MTLPIETDRLTIREYTARDLDGVAAVLGDPRVFWWKPRPLDRAGSRAWLAGEMRFSRRDGSGMLAVVLKATGRIIGGVALKPRDMPWGREYEIGYHLASREWGKGYATEAALALLSEARSRGLRRVVAFIDPGNARSKAVSRRCGLSYERDIVWAGTPHELWAAAIA